MAHNPFEHLSVEKEFFIIPFSIRHWPSTAPRSVVKKKGKGFYKIGAWSLLAD